MVFPLLLASVSPNSHDRPNDSAPLPPDGPFWSRDGEDLLLDYVFRTQDVGNLALALSNHAFIGNNFSERTSSMEYPKGSEVDHLVRGGLWIGGISTSLDTLVTTGVQDGYWGSYSRPTEWVPVSIPSSEYNLGWIRERSTLPTSPYYDPMAAISEQDFITSFLDTLDHAHTPQQGNNDDYHFASGLTISQESYAWSYEPADAMILIKWTIVPTRRLSQAHLGIYAEMTTGWKGKYPVGDWPPSSANWFHHHQLVWIDDVEHYAELSEDPMNLVAEYHYTYDDGNAPQHAGIKLLGAKYKHGNEEWNEDLEVSWRWWDWEPGSYQKDNDSEKFALLAQDGIDDWTEIFPSADNSGDSPIQILVAGPWELYPESDEPADTLVISAAFLAGDDMDDLVQNALYAQKVYSFNFTVPTPPHSPRTLVDNSEGKVRLFWEDSPLRSVDPVTHDYDFEGFRVYVGRDEEESSFHLLQQVDLAELPAKNPNLDSYFTGSWIQSELDAHPEWSSAQELLDFYWPGIYTYHDGEEEPFMVTEPDSLGYNTGFASVLLPEDEWQVLVEDGDSLVFKYAFDLENVSDGHHYWFSVTSYDLGNPETPSLESGRGQNVEHVIPGPDTWEEGRPVSVFPNPYRGSAVWDGNRATGRYLWFVGLPEKARIRIFTLAGDHVDTIHFDSETYSGENASAVNFGGDDEPVLSGTMAAWNLLSRNGQPVATGLYLFSVEDLSTGQTQQGKFLILK
ncbi:MAG: hypothetical protein QF492_06685 [Candidatus Krumholzibacteria bacterium]|jgi:hypothetical protein|nr:hypothetical protein [Candidatus Krumholzibacteria bacterium]MDP6669569.1 hypothetical protein [Candidatus Krumholzibacteria bacterium]